LDVHGWRQNPWYLNRKREFTASQPRGQEEDYQGRHRTPTPSDRRFKKDIKLIGKHKQTGVPLYRFKYLWGSQEYEGVMAQDILNSYPEAVVIDTEGYYLVDYEVLGVEFREV
jgi:hypothetical protein